MARVKKTPASRKRRRRILQQAKGYRGARGNRIRMATEAVERGLAFAYRDRKTRKRNFRRLWISRIGAGCAAEGISYSVFMNSMKKAHVELDRKVIADLAVRHPAAFRELVKIATGV